MTYVPKRRKNETWVDYFARLSPKARAVLGSKQGKQTRKTRSDKGKTHNMRVRKAQMMPDDIIKWGNYYQVGSRQDYDKRFSGDNKAPTYNNIIECFGSWQVFRTALKNSSDSLNKRTQEYYDFENNKDKDYVRLCISLGYLGGSQKDYNAIRGMNPKGVLISLYKIKERFGSFTNFKKLVHGHLDSSILNEFIAVSFQHGYRLSFNEAQSLDIDIEGVQKRLGKQFFNVLLYRKEKEMFKELGIPVRWDVWLRSNKGDSLNEK